MSVVDYTPADAPSGDPGISEPSGFDWQLECDTCHDSGWCPADREFVMCGCPAGAAEALLYEWGAALAGESHRQPPPPHPHTPTRARA